MIGRIALRFVFFVVGITIAVLGCVTAYEIADAGHAVSVRAYMGTFAALLIGSAFVFYALRPSDM